MGKPAADRGFTEHTVSEPVPPLVITDPTTLHRLPIPVRRRIVDDWLPVGHVTLSYGDGGIGKTLLTQQLMTSCATGTPWCGLAVRRCRVFGIFCEDDGEELHRRQHKINIAAECDFSDLEDMCWASAVGADNALVQFVSPGEWRLTPRFHELSKAAKEFHAELLIVDTADTFGGNENDRQQVRTFLGAVLTELARDTGCAVLVNAHPSRSGMGQNGDMDGGSTAWSNTARSRWALVRPQGEDGDAGNESVRQLFRCKANYSSIGDTIDLRWKDGVLVRVRQGGPATFASINRRQGAETKFLELVAKCKAQNIVVSNSKNSSNFAPKVFAKRPEREGYSRPDFEGAMHALFAARRITNVQYGRKSDVRFKIGLADEAEPDVDAEPLTERDMEVEGWRALCEAMGIETPARAAE